MVAKPTIANSAVSIDPLKSSAAPQDEPFSFGDFPNSSQDCRASRNGDTPPYKNAHSGRYANANARFALFDDQYVSRKRGSSGPADPTRIEERELQLHIAEAQERIEGTRVRAEEIRLEVQREKTATAKVQIELQGAMLAVRKLDLENERMRHELHVQQSSRDPGRAAQLDVQARIAAIQHQTALVEKDIASAKSESHGMAAANKGLDKKIWDQRAAAAQSQVDEQKARLELATRQGGTDQASLDRSVSASLDLMRVLISKGQTEALMIPLAVLKQAGLTDGMLASLTASELAGALPTDGGAVEPPVPYVDTFANGGARSLDALANGRGEPAGALPTDGGAVEPPVVDVTEATSAETETAARAAVVDEAALLAEDLSAASRAVEPPAVAKTKAKTKAASAKNKAASVNDRAAECAAEIARLAAENARLEAGLAVKKLKADGARGARSEPFFAIAEVRMGKPAAAAAVSGAEVAPRTGGPRRRISEL